jgi:hypothetical protein
MSWPQLCIASAGTQPELVLVYAARLLGRRLPVAALLFSAIPAATRAQQPDFTVGPFLSYFPSAGASPLAGLALTLANGPVAFRGSGHLSLASRSSLNPGSSTPGVRTPMSC